MAARLTSSVRFPAKWASCRARTARRCSARGETQAVTLATLGTGDDVQEFDSYTGGENEKKFILHYNFPNFSVGETGRISGPGRREIGHGALAERSIEPMLPLEELSLHHPRHERDHGIERLDLDGDGLRRHPGAHGRGRSAGSSRCRHQRRHLHRIRAGKKISRYQLLTDIIGWEDHYCDMDCKIAGTEKGITGFQLDLKLQGHCRTR